MPTSPPQPWSLADAFETYGVRSWGAGYFGINDKGNVTVHAGRQRPLVGPQGAGRRGPPPRHPAAAPDPLHRRAPAPGGPPQRGVQEGHRRARLQGRLPRRVPDQGEPAPLRGETIVEAGRQYDYGLEAGSKPELLAVMALLDSPDALIICNGYKDEEYVETALFASQARPQGRAGGREADRAAADRRGRAPVPASARASAFGCKLSHPRRRQVGGLRRRPEQVRPLGSSELMRLDRLHAGGGAAATASSCLHFHLGSQISNIRNVKNALREAGRFYVEVARQGAPLQVPRRRRRPGRRLRRLADQLRLVDELHHRRSTRTTWCSRVHARRATRRRCRTPPWSPSRAARWSRTTRCWSPRCWASSEFDAAAACPTRCPSDAPPVVKNLSPRYRDADPQERARGVPRRHRVQGRVPHPLLARPPLARRARDGREPLLGALPEDPAHRRASSDEMPEELETLERQLSDTYFCNFSRVPVAARLAGRSISCSRSCRSTGSPRSPTPPRRAGGHHLRLGREDRALHRPARREGRAGAAPAQRRRLLPRHLPGRRVPGDPRRPAQPLRRHARGAGVARARAAAT